MHFKIKERGQGMVDYALLIVLVVIVVVITIELLGTRLFTMYSYISSKFPMH